jgi:hypothetical protein
MFNKKNEISDSETASDELTFDSKLGTQSANNLVYIHKKHQQFLGKLQFFVNLYIKLILDTSVYLNTCLGKGLFNFVWFVIF